MIIGAYMMKYYEQTRKNFIALVGAEDGTLDPSLLGRPFGSKAMDVKNFKPFPVCSWH